MSRRQEAHQGALFVVGFGDGLGQQTHTIHEFSGNKPFLSRFDPKVAAVHDTLRLQCPSQVCPLVRCDWFISCFLHLFCADSEQRVHTCDIRIFRVQVRDSVVSWNLPNPWLVASLLGNHCLDTRTCLARPVFDV